MASDTPHRPAVADDKASVSVSKATIPLAAALATQAFRVSMSWMRT
jgi:hypothetical protein